MFVCQCDVTCIDCVVNKITKASSCHVSNDQRLDVCRDGQSVHCRVEIWRTQGLAFDEIQCLWVVHLWWAVEGVLVVVTHVVTAHVEVVQAHVHVVEACARVRVLRVRGEVVTHVVTVVQQGHRSETVTMHMVRDTNQDSVRSHCAEYDLGKCEIHF